MCLMLDQFLWGIRHMFVTFLVVQSICLAYLNMFARFGENPAMTLQDIKETKRYGRTHAHTDGWTT